MIAWYWRLSSKTATLQPLPPLTNTGAREGYGLSACMAPCPLITYWYSVIWVSTLMPASAREQRQIPTSSIKRYAKNCDPGLKQAQAFFHPSKAYQLSLSVIDG
jgi:hypothetical protein